MQSIPLENLEVYAYTYMRAIFDGRYIIFKDGRIWSNLWNHIV